MKKLNGNTFWLNGEWPESDRYFDEIQYQELIGLVIPTAYYLEGIPEIEQCFPNSNYLKAGYVTTLVVGLNSVGIGFTKYKFKNEIDKGLAFIKRENITYYEKIVDSNIKLSFIVESFAKEHSKAVLGKTNGLLGALILKAAESMVDTPTYEKGGTIYNLYYNNKFQEEKCLKIYCKKKHEPFLDLFLENYYVPSLSQNIIDFVVNDNQVGEGSNACFIASACYKNPYSPEIILFRRFRDEYLINSLPGKLFIKTYYILSPNIFPIIYKNKFISINIKYILDKLYILIKKNLY